MHPTNKSARVAGALYLLVAVTAPFGLIYVPSKLIVSGNATATASNILGSEMLFRMGILSELLSTAGASHVSEKRRRSPESWLKGKAATSMRDEALARR